MKALAKHVLSPVLSRLFALALALALGFTQTGALAQNPPAFTQAQLDQLLAPIALYPDPLLSQILMASTYPLEVVEAARWSKAHPGLKGDDAVRAVAQQNWDPSVKSLVAFPQVLAWMDENLEWTRSLGDAFLAQEPQVMETVQTLRQRAQAAGTLRSDDRYRVVSEAGAIAVVPASPQIIYVPYYDPLVVYGPWWWPAYPPVHWRPWPDYYARPGYATGFYWGPGIGISAGFFFGAVDWHRRNVRVTHVNYYNTVIVNRRNAGNAREAPVNRGPGTWQHDPSHRRGIAYRDPELQKRFGAWKTEQRAEPRRERPQAGAPRAEARPARVQPPPRPAVRPEPPRAAPPAARAPSAAPRPHGDAGARPAPPSANVPPPASHPADPEPRRKAAPRREAPQEGAPRPEARWGHPSQANPTAANRPVPKNLTHPEAGPPAKRPHPEDKDQDRKERRRD